jgi:hypothetical protein
VQTYKQCIHQVTSKSNVFKYTKNHKNERKLDSRIQSLLISFDPAYNYSSTRFQTTPFKVHIYGSIFPQIGIMSCKDTNNAYTKLHLNPMCFSSPKRTKTRTFDRHDFIVASMHHAYNTLKARVETIPCKLHIYGSKFSQIGIISCKDTNNAYTKLQQNHMCLSIPKPQKRAQIRGVMS